MKLSFSTLGCPDWRWEEIFACAKDMGYDGVEVRGVGKEIFVPNIPQLREENLPKTLAGLERLGMTIPVLTSGCEIHKRYGIDETLFKLKSYIDLAQRISTPYVRVLADTNPMPGPVDTALVKDAASLMAGYAFSKGVCILLETNGYYSDTEKLAKLVQGVGGDGIGVLWDINHPFRYNNESVSTTLGNIGKYVKHVHIKDSAMEDGKLRYKVTGRGDLPVEESVRALLERGYEGFFSLEWVRRWDGTLEEPSIAFALYAQYMRRLAK